MLPRKPSPSAHVMCGLGPACSVLWGRSTTHLEWFDWLGLVRVGFAVAFGMTGWR